MKTMDDWKQRTAEAWTFLLKAKSELIYFCEITVWYSIFKFHAVVNEIRFSKSTVQNTIFEICTVVGLRWFLKSTVQNVIFEIHAVLIEIILKKTTAQILKPQFYTVYLQIMLKIHLYNLQFFQMNKTLHKQPCIRSAWLFCT